MGPSSKKKDHMFSSISFNQTFPINWLFHLLTSAGQACPGCVSIRVTRKSHDSGWGDCFTVGVQHLISCLSCLYLSSMFCLAFCLFFNLFILHSQCLQVSQMLIIAINIWLLAMFCSLISVSSWLLLTPRPDILLSWPLTFLVVCDVLNQSHHPTL